MKLTFRLLIYAACITATLLFGVFGGWQDMKAWWFWLLGCIVAAEVLTRYSIRKRNKPNGSGGKQRNFGGQSNAGHE